MNKIKGYVAFYKTKAEIESRGGRARSVLRTAFGWDAVEATDLLERRTVSEALGDASPGESVALRLRPFELVTLRFHAPRPR